MRDMLATLGGRGGGQADLAQGFLPMMADVIPLMQWLKATPSTSIIQEGAQVAPPKK